MSQRNETPKWKEDFPVKWGADNYVTRREFTKYLVLTSAATFLGNGVFVATRLSTSRRELPPTEVAKVDEIKVGGSKVFKYPDLDEPAILVRVKEREFVAYNQKCTHLSSPVIYDHGHNCLYCPFHHGSFELNTGRPTAGPPTRPLTKINIRVEGDRVIAEGVVRV